MNISEQFNILLKSDFRNTTVIEFIVKNEEIAKIENITSDVAYSIIGLGQKQDFPNENLSEQLISQNFDVNALDAHLKEMKNNVNSYLKARGCLGWLHDLFIARRFFALKNLQENLPVILSEIEKNPQIQQVLKKIAKLESESKGAFAKQEKIEKIEKAIAHLGEACNSPLGTKLTFLAVATSMQFELHKELEKIKADKTTKIPNYYDSKEETLEIAKKITKIERRILKLQDKMDSTGDKIFKDIGAYHLKNLQKIKKQILKGKDASTPKYYNDNESKIGVVEYITNLADKAKARTSLIF